MRHPNAASTQSRQMRLGSLVGAALAAAVGGYFTVVGIDYGLHGCACDEPLFPDWFWVVPIGLALPFYAAAALLVLRVLRVSPKR